MVRDARATRERIVQAADALFYGEGIRSTSLDAIAAKAGVTKRTLYYHFPSKDDLIAAYLAARDEPTFARQAAWLDETKGNLPEQVIGLFENLARVMTTPRWKGCGFIRAAAELAGTASAAFTAAALATVGSAGAAAVATGAVSDAATSAINGRYPIRVTLFSPFSAICLNISRGTRP